MASVDTVVNIPVRVTFDKQKMDEATIEKLKFREENTPTLEEQEYLRNVINALFTSTASIHLKEVDDDLTVEIFDSVYKKVVLVLNFKHYGCNLYFQSYRLSE
ncbi:MAG: hypothetical protein VB130_05645 [Clostridium sp.]|nr:hypothetical protein [Clostridium sp.]